VRGSKLLRNQFLSGSMERGYDEYKSDIKNRIASVIEELKSQPILFVGTGLSIRYFGAPGWKELLREMADSDAVDREYEFYQQTMADEKEIAEEFAGLYNEWAWDDSETGGRDEYPSSLFDPNQPSDIYLKHSVASHLEQLTPKSTSDLSEADEREIDMLREIQPHAVITTNYDTFLEDFVFPEYERVIGQRLIEEPFANIGEIFKIHGCVTEPAEIVLTQSDYDAFDTTKEYLSAKLLTFFTEHPVLIVGYEPNDPNVKRILSGVNQAISDTDRQPNIFLVDYVRETPDTGNINQEKLVEVGDGDEMVVNYIRANSFDWIFESFSESGEIKGVNSKLLRKLINNTYEIIREEAPQREIAVGKLENIAGDKDQMLDILGIAPLDAEEPPEGVEGDPSSIAEAGVPVGQIISQEDVDDLEDKLAVAVESWRQYEVLFEDRGVIYTFYNQRRELDLSTDDIEFLFKSSITNMIQGSEWLIRYNGDLDALLSESVDILNGRTVAALERDLLALGKEEILREICDTELADSAMSNAESYLEKCDLEPEDRIKEYTGETIYYQDGYSVDSLLSGTVNPVELQDQIVSSLIEDDDGDLRTALRKVELIRIVNSPLCSD
jgi:hypothetical protein